MPNAVACSLYRHPAVAQLCRYCLVGGVNTLVGVSLMAAGAAAGLPYYLYTTLAYLIAMTVSFYLNFRFTFQNTQRYFVKKIKFLAVNLTLLAGVNLFQMLAIEHWNWYEYLAVGVGMVGYTLLGYGLNRTLVFKEGA